MANKKLVYTIYFTLRVLVIVMMVAQFFNGNFENVFFANCKCKLDTRTVKIS